MAWCCFHECPDILCCHIKHELSEDGPEHNRCPICGSEFSDEQIMRMPKPPKKFRCLRCNEDISKDSLITDDDDYAWCL